MKFASSIAEIILLVSSFIVSFAIFWLQVRLEKKSKERDEKTRGDNDKKILEEQARIFLIDNEDEIEFLPLAQIATVKQSSRVIHYDGSGRYKQKRKIYSRFHRCEKELQKEILRQSKFKDHGLEKYDIDEIIGIMLDLFERDAKDLGILSFGGGFLYDDAKYFRRGLDRYGNQKITEFEGLNLEHCIWVHLSDFMNYKMEKDKEKAFNNWFKNPIRSLFGSPSPLYDKIVTLEQYKTFFSSSPLDLYWNKVTSAPEDSCALVVMEMIRQATILINREKYKILIEGYDYPDLETYEDLYYATFLELYSIYGNQINNLPIELVSKFMNKV